MCLNCEGRWGQNTNKNYRSSWRLQLLSAELPSGYMLARGPQLTGDAISDVLWGLDKGPNQMNMKF